MPRQTAAAAYLLSLRQAAGKTQSDIAIALKMPYASLIGDYEAGRVEMPLRYFRAFAIAVDVDLPTFLMEMSRLADFRIPREKAH